MFRAQSLFLAVLCVGLLCVAKAVMDPDLEWRLFAMAGLAFALNPFKFEARTRNGSESVPIPLWHSALFAGAISLGPFGSALPAAFCGLAGIIFGPNDRKPLHQFLYFVMKPVAACTVTAIAYVALGGSVLRPHTADSFLPMLAAGFVYMAANTLLVARQITDPPVSQTRPHALFAAWALCLLAGYAMATLYAVAPTYVLLGPCIAVGFAGFALRGSGQIEVVQEVEEPEANVVEITPEPVETKIEVVVVDDSNSFVDSATGLASENYLNIFLRQEISRAHRSGQALSVAVFDIDGARAMNNSGLNEALIELGKRLKSGLRDYDLIARHSSHRLLIVLPEASAEDAYDVAVRLHRISTETPFNGKPLSASVGIATYPEHGATPEELINASHRVLNHGRFMGPNCVHASHRMAKAG